MRRRRTRTPAAPAWRRPRETKADLARPRPGIEEARPSEAAANWGPEQVAALLLLLDRKQEKSPAAAPSLALVSAGRGSRQGGRRGGRLNWAVCPSRLGEEG
jgi:hypothetical protein